MSGRIYEYPKELIEKLGRSYTLHLQYCPNCLTNNMKEKYDDISVTFNDSGEMILKGLFSQFDKPPKKISRTRYKCVNCDTIFYWENLLNKNLMRNKKIECLIKTK